jgi:hypothetical protein
MNFSLVLAILYWSRVAWKIAEDTNFLRIRRIE